MTSLPRQRRDGAEGSGYHFSGIRTGVGGQPPDPDRGGLLRLGAERRGEEAEEERADLAALRAASSGIPVILQPGRIGPEELAGYAAEFGAVAVLDKPLSVGELVEAVRGAIEGR